MDGLKQKRRWKGHAGKGGGPSTYHNLTPEVDDETKILIDQLFQKSFTYPNDTEWTLPDHNNLFTAPPWQCDELQAMKLKLNQTKNLLSDLDIKNWHSHTQNTHRASHVAGILRNSIQVELCTQAWCKFYEILGTYDIVRPVMGTFSSVHMCEAPGAFITSLNHFVKSRGDYIQWLWLGNTLNPYYEGNGLESMIDDDRIIFDTLDNWFFGADNTGDLTEPRNVSGLIETASTIGPVNLVTADGSIDCANNPAEQESIVSQLHYCELVTGLSILAPGGSFVIKMFTMCEDSSIALMYILNCLFEEVNVIKPTTSKPGNSEVYVVATGFRGISQEWKDNLLSSIGKPGADHAMISQSLIPESFIHAHVDCCEKFVTWQIDTIKENLWLFKHSGSDTTNKLENAKRYCADHYLKKFSVRAMDKSKRVVPPLDWSGKKRKGLDTHRPGQSRRHTGSYTKRKEQLALPWKERVLQMEPYSVDTDSSQPLQWLKGGACVVDVCDWQIVTGKALDEIRSSRFCDKHLLKDYNDFLKQIETGGRRCPLAQRMSTDFITEMIKMMTHTENHVSIVKCENSCNESFFINECQKLKSQIIIKSPEARAGVEPCVYVYEEHLESESKESKWLLRPPNTSVINKIFQNLQVGDSLVLTTVTPLTRVQASLMFLLHSHFDQVSLSSCPGGSTPLVYTLCTDFTGCSHSLLQYLSTLSQQCVDTEVQQSLLSFVPIQDLHGEAFSMYLQTQNDVYLRRRLDFLLDKEQKHWSSKAD